MIRLVEIVSAFTSKDKDAIDVNASLKSLGIQNSLSIWKLHAAIERTFHTKLVGNLNQGLTIQDIYSLITGNSNVVPSTLLKKDKKINLNEITTLGRGSIIGIGTDLEEIEQFPEVEDYRQNDFYSKVFTQKEISKSILGGNIRESLCAIFCAKESVKKSHALLFNLPMKSIEISNNAEGQPLVIIHDNVGEKLSFHLSLSHTNKYATATVLTYVNT
ncbi:4'-phosphopantetheinyl transferase superfamily protein [Dolichospermum sp. ST_sed1]|nr:4'-phosphopantetheinyl transferase superfamily protein [Dolichospermum sp. ST_sed1]